MSKTCPHCDVTSKKTPTKMKSVFISISSRTLTESVDGLDSSLAQSPGELWPQKCRPIYWLSRSLKGLMLVYIGIAYHILVIENREASE